MSPRPPEREAQPESPGEKRQPAFSIGDPEPADAGERDAGAPVSLEATPGALPAHYGHNRLWSIARDPHALFLYWQLVFPVDRFPGARLAIAVHRADGVHEATAFLGHPAGTRFLEVSRPGHLYHLALGFLPPGKLGARHMLFVIARSSVRTPRDRPLTRIAGTKAGDGILASRNGPSGARLAMLFPNLDLDFSPSGSPLRGHCPASRRIAIPPERPGFLPPAS